MVKNRELLDAAISEAEKIMQSCEFCERRCKVNRLKNELGFCKVGKEWGIFGTHAHYGEEAELIPSGTIFLAGCSLRCCYCQNAPESITPSLGEVWSDEEVAAWIDKKANECKNVNFVTPDCYVWHILKVLKLIKANIPVVWNSSSYYSEKTAFLVKDFVDIYLLDFRYFSDRCAEKLSKVTNYVEAAKRNHLIADKYGELIIRILVMPNHIECCIKPALKWIKDNLSEKAKVNIMDQYRPEWLTYKFEEINRMLTLDEYEDVVNFAKKIGLRNFT